MSEGAGGEGGRAAAEPWTVGRVARWAADDFKARGIEGARLEAELLLAHVLKVDRVRILTDPSRPLEAGELAAYRELIRRRRAREPVAYLLGVREFYGRPFRVDRRVLIPRPDTETLVEVALARTRHRSLSGRALDLCTGSGCVAVTFARERPTWRVDGADLSPGAVAVARDNALRLGAVWNVRWLVGDLYAPLDPARDRYDLVTANPPYIPRGEIAALDPDIRDFEPRVALDGGESGLELAARVVRGAPPFLRPGALLALEIMTGQGADARALFERAGFADVEVANDYGGRERVVSGRWPAR
ncbi:MAG TPA: peptide chain release factor N(5)-glutamine methyltransferase [Polyangiaceae bacterium]|nr:peptide chain release factor N(5)-glutamine methyltransferase [Polyangiaceae bacterium]